MCTECCRSSFERLRVTSENTECCTSYRYAVLWYCHHWTDRYVICSITNHILASGCLDFALHFVTVLPAAWHQLVFYNWLIETFALLFFPALRVPVLLFQHLAIFAIDLPSYLLFQELQSTVPNRPHQERWARYRQCRVKVLSLSDLVTVALLSAAAASSRFYCPPLLVFR